MEQKKILLRKDLAKSGKERGGAWKRRAFHELFPDEQASLRLAYNDAEILAVEALSEHEKQLFSPDGTKPFNFHVQALYKLKGIPDPGRLSDALRELTEREEFLRTNYCPMGREVYKIILAERKDLPLIIFQTLEHLTGEDLDKTLRQIAETDMGQEFDLRTGVLYRLSVFRTGEDECALLMTVSRMIAPRFRLHEILGSISPDTEGIDAPSPAPEANPPEDDTAYWKGFLEDLPPHPMLPYEKTGRIEDYRQMSYHSDLPGNLFHGLQKFSSGDRKRMISILSIAWGILLLEANNCRDTYFFLLTSDSPGFNAPFRILPMRLCRESDRSMEKTVDSQSGKIEEAMKRGPADFSSLPLDHFLSFYGFLDEGKSYSESAALSGGNLLSRNLWAARNLRLGVYFRWERDLLSIVVLYDQSRFKPYGIKLMARRYAQILQQMLLDWRQPISSFAPSEPSPLRHHADEDRHGLHDLISRMELMQGIELHVLQKDLLHPRTVSYTLGNRIPREDLQTNFIFVLAGRIARNIETKSGWYNFLDVRGANSWLNEANLLPTHQTRLAADVMSREATLLYIPLTEMTRLMNDEPIIERRILFHVISEMERYQRLWVQL